MKLKYFIPAFVALLGAMMVSCSDDDSMTLLDEIQVSRSYVPISIDGGEASIDVTAQDSWSFDAEEIPAWLTITPMQGGAGETKVFFKADKAPDGRSAELHINCAGRTQNINVIQGLAEIHDATCAEVIAGPESKTYRVTGTVTNIYNTTYGNWYLVDETGSIQIYGTLDKNGQTKNFLSLGLEEGDIVTVEGPKTVYNGQTELVDVTVVKIVKSLIKVESMDPEDGLFPLEGGDVTVNLACKGNGVSVEIPDEAKSWLSMVSISGGSAPVVKFHAAPNTGGDRSVDVVFKTSDGKQEYTATTTLKQTGAIVEVTAAQFLEAAEGDTQYRITGVIQKVAGAAYGNVYLRDYSGEIYVYGIGSKGDFEKLGLKEGDIVTLVGKRSSYKGDPQMAGAQYEKHIPVTDVTVSEFMSKPDDKNTYYRVTGEITSLKDSKGNDNVYGNMYISDDEEVLYVYGCYPGYGATGDFRKGFVANAGIEVGDKITIIGYKDTYNGLVELCGGIYFSHAKSE